MQTREFGCAILVYLLITLFVVAAWVQGVCLAFSASVTLGIVCFVIEVPLPIIGVVYWVTGVDLAQKIVEAFPGIFN